MKRSRLTKLLLVLALVYFCARGPYRALFVYPHHDTYNDVGVLYCNARAWLHHQDPYLTASFLREWVAGGGASTPPGPSLARAFAPPAALPYAAPLAAFDWARFSRAMVALMVIAFAVMALKLPSLFEMDRERKVLLVAYALALAPIHTAIGVGNISAILVPLIVLCWWCSENEYDLWAGILMGVVAAFKPPLAVPLFLYFLVAKRWRPLLSGATTLAASMGVFLIAAAPGWLASLAVRVRGFAVGGPEDYVLANPARHQLLNLQVIPAGVGAPRLACDLIAWTVAGVLLVWWFKSSRSLPVLLVISLLPFYHRFYEAGVLVLPFGVALARRSRSVLVLCCAFCVPLATALHEWVLIHSTAWDLLVLAHGTWILLAISVLMLLQESRQPAPGATTVRYGAPAESLSR